MNNKEKIYEHEFLNIPTHNKYLSKMRAAESLMDDYEVAFERFIRIIRKLPSPMGTFFSIQKRPSCTKKISNEKHDGE